METNESSKKPKMPAAARIINAIQGCGRVRAEELATSLSEDEQAELVKRYNAKDGAREWLCGLLDARADAKRAEAAKAEAAKAEAGKAAEVPSKHAKKTEPTSKPSADVVSNAGA